MTLCPIAIAVGCRKCPIFKLCPAKGLIGDMPSAARPDSAPAVKTKPAAKKPSAGKKPR
ncbi:hypothetical protein LNV07_03075 [Paucibacter oligotrophus]|uniref:Uncharacterized protein n=1 Tax=Roseateles oligotrophus TaxID=1769250 RepID=A0ABT2Y9U3_9BURK|nr:hypothetical protein [Roseateles oligotrophus]